MASILTIPLELLVSISSHLPTSDLASFRLTCKQVEKSLYEWFSTEFFTKKQFMLTYPSLQTLIDISKHVSLSKKLKHVIVATNVYSDRPLRFRDADAATCYIQGHEDQEALVSRGRDREMLTEAFQHLVNLDTVGIRDFNSASRVRDGAFASWSSWGATTVQRETGVHLQFSDRGSTTTQNGGLSGSQVFSTVLYALGKANRFPSEFEVLLRQHGLSDKSFHIPEFDRSTTEPVLLNIKRLLLNVDLGTRNFHTHGSGVAADEHAGRSLRRFLSWTNLTHLRLNFQKHMIAQNEGFLAWLGASVLGGSGAPCSSLDPAPVALPSLQKLDLGQLSVAPDILLAIVTKFASTLEEMSFWRMALRSRVPAPAGDKPNLWANFFTKLATVRQLKLKHLKVGMLQQDHSFVNFKPNYHEIDQAVKVKEYTGKEMDVFMRELVDYVFVIWPELPEDLDSASDEEMADEYGEHEDESEDESEDDE